MRYALGGSLVFALISLSIGILKSTDYNFLFITFFPLLLLIGSLLLFWSLTIELTNDHLSHYFGPNFWKKTYPINSITEIKKSSFPWYYGWGIRLTPKGWMYNVSGFQVLEITFTSGKRILLGTDDLNNLHATLSKLLG